MNTSENINEPTTPAVPAFTLSERDKPFIGPARPAAADLVGLVAPTHIQGDRQRERDLKDWQQDMADRQQRSQQLAEKRRLQSAKQEVNVVAKLDAALEALELGVTDFEQSYGKANQPLIDATMEVDRLRSELAAAESRLAGIKDRGDSVQRLQGTVTRGEGALNGLLSAAEERAMRQLVTEKFGWEAPMQKVGRDTLKELALDISVQSLKEFVVPSYRQQTNDVAVLQQRLDTVGQKLTDLRAHLHHSED